MRHFLPTKSFWNRALLFCLGGVIFFVSGRVFGQVSADSICALSIRRIQREANQFAFNNVFDSAATCLATSKTELKNWEPTDDTLYLKAWGMQFFLEGRLAKSSHQYDEAIAAYIYAKKVFEQLEAMDAPNSNYLNVLLDLGNLHEIKREMKSSRSYHEMTLKKITEFLPKKVNNVCANDSAYVYSGLGNIMLEEWWSAYGRNEEASRASLKNALHYYRMSLAVRKRNGGNKVKTALSFENLASALIFMDSLDQAQEATDSALHCLNGLGGDEVTVGKSFVHLVRGDILMRRQDYQGAEREFRAAFNLRVGIDIEFPPQLSEPLHQIALAKLSQGDSEGAFEFAEMAVSHLRTNEESSYNRDEIEVLSTIADIYTATGREIDALKCYSRISDLAAELRKNAPGEQAKLHASGDGKVVKAHCEGIRLAVRLFHQTGDTAYFDQAFELSEKTKAAMLLENVKEAEIFNAIMQGRPPEIVASLTQLRNLRLAISATQNALETERDGDASIELMDKGLKLQLEYNESLEALRRDYPEEFELISNAFDDILPVTPAEVQRKMLPERKAMVAYCLCDDRLTTLVIDRKGRYAKETTLSPEFFNHLDDLLRGIRLSGMGKPNEAENFRAASGKVYEVLIAPILDSLRKHGIQRLTIIPDGKLSYLSFDVLLPPGPDNAGFAGMKDEFLIQKFYLSYEYSATLLKTRMEKHRVLDRNRVGVFSIEKFARFTALKKNSKVAAGIARATGGVLYENSEADRMRFFASNGNFDVAVASSHSVADDSLPSNSFLVLSRPDRVGLEDSLFAFEFYHSPLNINHLFLAACETGTGTLRRGEGIFSLGRAITAAGCASTAVSLWNVVDDSASTGEIMRSYFRNLAGGMEKDIALGEAKRAYLNAEGKADWDYRPYFWSELVITGSTAPTPMEWRENWWLPGVLGGAAAVVLLLLLLYLWKRKKRQIPI